MTRVPPRAVVVRTIRSRPVEKAAVAAATPPPIGERPPRPGPLEAAVVGLGRRVRKVGDLNYLDGEFRPVQEIIREYNRACLESGREQVGPDYLRV